MEEGCWDLTIANSKKAGELEECRKYNVFQQAVSKIGKRPYTEEYNCLDHVKDLQKELEKVGIKSVILIREDRGHSLLAVFVDYNGYFFSPDEDFKILEVRDGEMRIMCHKDYK